MMKRFYIAFLLLITNILSNKTRVGIKNHLSISLRSKLEEQKSKDKLQKRGDENIIPEEEPSKVKNSSDENIQTSQENTGQLVTPVKTIPITHKGWLRVASYAFSDKRRYPNVPVVQQGGNMALFDPVDFAQTKGNQKFENSIGNENFGKNPNIKHIDSFYVRLQGNYVYFTETETDTNILANFKFTQMKDSSQFLMPGCFTLGDGVEEWFFCDEDQTNADAWICDCRKALGQKCERTVGVETVTTEKLIQPMIIVPLPNPDCSVDWNYNQHGQDWQCRCSEGQQQSPVDLDVGPSYEMLNNNAEFAYQNVSKDKLNLVYQTNMIRIKFIKNAELIFGTIKDVDGTRYEATEIQIHTPGEHTVNGNTMDMEIQVIHEAKEGNIKNQAVLSLMFQNSPGTINKAISEWNLIDMVNPTNHIKNGEIFFQNDFNVLKLFNDQSIFDNPSSFNYYKYMGSLTSPPCEENIVWFLAYPPIDIGTTTLQMIRDALNRPDGDDITNRQDNRDGSFRPVQPINNRKVYFYDAKRCSKQDEQQDSGAEPKGHWFKESRDVEKFFYVSGSEPSKIENSFVVSKQEAENGLKHVHRNTDRYGINGQD